MISFLHDYWPWILTAICLALWIASWFLPPSDEGGANA